MRDAHDRLHAAPALRRRPLLPPRHEVRHAVPLPPRHLQPLPQHGGPPVVPGMPARDVLPNLGPHGAHRQLQRWILLYRWLGHPEPHWGCHGRCLHRGALLPPGIRPASRLPPWDVQPEDRGSGRGPVRLVPWRAVLRPVRPDSPRRQLWGWVLLPHRDDGGAEPGLPCGVPVPRRDGSPRAVRVRVVPGPGGAEGVQRVPCRLLL
mmetsp:Transcript_104/g.273  ORF Transcript_104/g.273 Transcript_104/m.273 type:complete len:206 (+) Transcript_104:2428-3045(+)